MNATDKSVDIKLKYGELIDLPIPPALHHIRMDRARRAAQFAPFAALTGYEELVSEASRLTETKKQLDEGEIARLNALLCELEPKLPAPAVITYFCPDEKKSGGSYETVSGEIVKIDRQHKALTVKTEEDLIVIPMRELYDFEI